MESKGSRIEEAAPIDSHRPHVVAAAGNCVNAITVCARIRACYHRPGAAVPMQRQGLTGGELPIGVFTCSPDVIATAGCSPKEVTARAYIRASYPRPYAAVPVQRERHTRPTRGYPVRLHGAPPVPTWLATMIVVHADGPDVVATAGCSEKEVAKVAWVRTWYQRPRAFVPADCQCPIVAETK